MRVFLWKTVAPLTSIMSRKNGDWYLFPAFECLEKNRARSHQLIFILKKTVKKSLTTTDYRLYHQLTWKTDSFWQTITITGRGQWHSAFRYKSGTHCPCQFLFIWLVEFSSRQSVWSERQITFIQLQQQCVIAVMWKDSRDWILSTGVPIDFEKHFHRSYG